MPLLYQRTHNPAIAFFSSRGAPLYAAALHARHYLCYNNLMDKLPEEELFEEYLLGETLDPAEYDQMALEKFHEMIGEEEGEY